MSNDRIWVLGASDPEMELIERVLRECGERVEYAAVWRDGVRRRVTAAEAYGPDVEIGWGLRGLRATAYMVECAPAVLVGSSIDGIDWGGVAVTIDHHRPGDPGYGRPPSEFLTASSLGQVISELARLGQLPWEQVGCGSYDDPVGCERGSLLPWYPHPGGGRVEDLPLSSAEWQVCIVAPGETGGDWGADPSDWAVVPRDLVLCAAADHCLPAAYRGECPGVDPDALMRWRAETRAAHQGRSVEELLADVEEAIEEIRYAPTLRHVSTIEQRRVVEAWEYDRVCNGRRPDPDTWYRRRAEALDAVYVPRGLEGVLDLRDYEVPELPEAAVREGVAYLATVVERDGRRKVVLGGHTTPECVRAFMSEWAPAHGLVGVYGDPARGFAGAYMPEAG